MEQIKVDELPVGYLVLDYWVPSGNKRFASKESTSDDLCDYCIGFNAINTRTKEEINKFNHNEVPCVRNPKEIFGTKHIQLVAANPRVSWWHNECLPNEDEGNVLEFKTIDDRWLAFATISHKTYQKANKLSKQGKDFFIYKVSEEK